MVNSNQFSLKTMMIAMAIISVLCCIFFTLPEWVGGIFLLIVTLLAMPAALALLVYGSGKARAFALGTMPPMAVIFSYFAGFGGRYNMPFFGSGSSFEVKVFFAIVMFVVVASGFIGQAVRWWCLPNEGPVTNDQSEGNADLR